MHNPVQLHTIFIVWVPDIPLPTGDMITTLPPGENDLISTQINKLNYKLQQVSIKEYTLNCFEAQNKEQTI